MKAAFAVAAISWIIFFVPAAFAQSLPEWEVGDRWLIRVEWSSPEPLAATPQGGTDMNVIVHEVPVKEDPTYRIDFFVLPELKAPGGETHRYKLHVAGDTGWPHSAESFKDYRQLLIDTFGTCRMFTYFAPGYPVEIIPEITAIDVGKGTMRSAESQTNTLTLKLGKAGQRIAMVHTGNGDVEIRQTWAPGEKWWREYERYRDGKLELRARLVLPKKPPVEPELPPLPPLVKSNAPAPPMVDLDKNPLKADARLHARVKGELGNPRMQHLFDRLTEATGVAMRGDPNVDFAAPVYGSVNWPSLPAWVAMTDIARASGGQWEKQEDGGYLLKGGSKPEPAMSGTWVWWIAGISLALLLLAGTAFLFRRLPTPMA